MKTYNHAYTIAFEVPGSTDEDGEDVTKEQLLDALKQRVRNIECKDIVLDAIGDPYDTYEEVKLVGGGK